MIYRIFIALALCAMSFGASAQTLTAAQIVTVRAAACADTGTARPLMLAGDANGLGAWLNNTTTFVVWKTSVTIRETGQAFNGTEWAGMTSANHTRLQTVAQYLATYNPGQADVRAMFNDIWSGAGGTTTRANLLVLWKRNATNAEKALATGNGADATPGTLTFEGSVAQPQATSIVYRDNGTLWGC